MGCDGRGLKWAGRVGLMFGSLLLSCLTLIGTSQADETRTETGKLTRKDRQLSTGEYYETFELEMLAGQTITLDLTSDQFDPWVQFSALDQEGNVDEDRVWFNDDFEGSSQRSWLEVPITAAGTYRIMVTSKSANETGNYELTIATRDAARDPEGRNLPPTAGGASERVEVGVLNRFDQQLENLEYYDLYPLELTAGTQVTVDLTSEDFDTYLYMRTDVDPEFVVVNDDFEDDRHHSRIEFTASADGVYRIYATSYNPEELGEYRLRMAMLDPRSGASGAAASTRREQGYLAKDDSQLTTGEYSDAYLIQGVPGQRVRIELTSSDFDPYLILRAPSGEQLENDDFLDARDKSVIETIFTEQGEYRLLVTSYSAGEVGAYDLVIELSAGGAGSDGGLETGARVNGELTDADSEVEGGRVGDVYYFNANAGDYVRIKHVSEQFDTMMVLTSPDGDSEVFDDEGEDRNAGINQRLTQSGRYTLTVTSYEAGERGSYLLSFDRSEAGSATAARRVFGVFVGIADYPGEGADLILCDVDAQTIYSLLRDNYGMRAEDSVLLVNEDATVDGVTGALRRIGQAAGPNDLLVFFYSGHGGQFSAEANSADPDGIHETLALYDGQVTDDDFAELINGSDAGIALVALDSCFSGGFAKDVVSARGRMGIFSSEEDVLSNVAAEFEAGGFLSRFFADALLDHRIDADLNSDQQLTAHELSHYLGERYREDVRSNRVKGGEGGVDSSENLSFQRLVVDRGGVTSTEVLFRW
ncbi:MAG: pre-peptidase C-terminal domain-containing protein [Planctomycetales bacterium]|nr:pre-peptidase C-terminal domain-containing protein [Planctomycetales bacterium]